VTSEDGPVEGKPVESSAERESSRRSNPRRLRSTACCEMACWPASRRTRSRRTSALLSTSTTWTSLVAASTPWGRPAFRLPPRLRRQGKPALGVLTHIAGSGIGADVASGGELEAVLRAGFAPVAIAMTGPGKRDDELAAAVTAGIGAVTVESLGELARLDAIAERLRRRQPILLRLAVADDAKFERVRLIGGAAGKFGMPLPVLREAAGIAAASPNLELLGVHAFGASNLLDASRLADHVAELVAVGEEVATATGVPLRLVDAGGGLGIPYADGSSPWTRPARHAAGGAARTLG